MSEYELLNLMYLFFVSNAMNFVGFVILTWLGFRFASNISFALSSQDLSNLLVTRIFFIKVD